MFNSVFVQYCSHIIDVNDKVVLCTIQLFIQILSQYTAGFHLTPQFEPV